MTRYKRDMRGYGATPPQVRWPNTARIAVQFVLNYEEGGENCTLHGDSKLRSIFIRNHRRTTLPKPTALEYGEHV